MVQAIIKISDRSNRILNIVKAKYGLRDKSQAINVLAKNYEEFILEREFKPEYVGKALKIHHQPSIMVGSVANLRKRYEK